MEKVQELLEVIRSSAAYSEILLKNYGSGKKTDVIEEMQRIQIAVEELKEKLRERGIEADIDIEEPDI